MAEENKMVTARVLAEELDLAVETIWRYTREGKIPFIELGNKQYRYKLADVIDALSDSTVKYEGNQDEDDNRQLVKEDGAGYKKEDEEFTYQDYLRLEEETGYQYEVLEGKLVKEPSPNVMHQRVSRRLQRILEDYFWKVDPESDIFNAPLDVTFSDTTVVQPDLFYIPSSENNIIKEKRIDGSPELVVEIISPYNPRKDRLQKMQIYCKAGINHYWLVNPEEKTLECFALRDGNYTLLVTSMDEDVVEHPEFEGLNISLDKLWE